MSPFPTVCSSLLRRKVGAQISLEKRYLDKSFGSFLCAVVSLPGSTAQAGMILSCSPPGAHLPGAALCLPGTIAAGWTAGTPSSFELLKLFPVAASGCTVHRDLGPWPLAVHQPGPVAARSRTVHGDPAPLCVAWATSGPLSGGGLHQTPCANSRRWPPRTLQTPTGSAAGPSLQPRVALTPPLPRQRFPCLQKHRMVSEKPSSRWTVAPIWRGRSDRTSLCFLFQ